jgi:hypothetical protein
MLLFLAKISLLAVPTASLDGFIAAADWAVWVSFFLP